ncbi:MAG: hypothetical protein LBQ79_15100 [Deltaproteobacteria bacterium]|jgi:hypothetical protein|nr:hypothetical protein [Deltaproteobacteria bacterium]
MPTSALSRPSGRAAGPRLAAAALAALAIAVYAPHAGAQDVPEQRPPHPESQEQPVPGQAPQGSERESQDLNTIATLSVGLVIQSFGYIGAYGDLLSSGAYDSQQVINMLGDTVRYLSNAHRDLSRYQAPGSTVSAGDRQYLAEVTTILELLIEEAESLRGFANTRAEGDLARYRSARDTAWKRIDRLIKP